MTGPVYTVTRKPLQQTEVAPVSSKLCDGALFLDFGKAAFGTLKIDSTTDASVVVHLGEKLDASGRIDREPGGTIRYIRIEHQAGPNSTRLVIPPDDRNTGPKAIKMPPEVGEVFPFRYAEIERADLDPDGIRQVMVHYPFDDNASSFESSNDVLNSVWELCKYSIKATTFCGVYVDGDRERIPYEGDAFINQLGHYCVDSEYGLARYSHEYMIQNPTWPTEWNMHSVMMAWEDYMYSGETASLEAFYDDLRVKTLIDLAREDGLGSVESPACTEEFLHRLHIRDGKLRDVVDWPPGSFTDGGTGERDNHEMCPINTVVNAFHCHVLLLMSRVAGALDRLDDMALFAGQAEKVRATINDLLFDESRGTYVDGEGSDHSSLHSNMFMLAFDLVPDDRKDGVLEFVKSRGMACSVYGAQHLLDALYLNGEDEYAFQLMTAKHDRSWWNMIEAGSTITLEAWDIKYKNNLDWNHAWGAAPANIIPRYILGVRPLEPGFREILIQPQPGPLKSVSGKVPTPHGPVTISLTTPSSGERHLEATIPRSTTAIIDFPHGTYTLLEE